MKGLLALGLRVAMAAALLAVLFRFVPPGEVAAVAGTLHPGYLVGGIALQYAVRLVTALRMKVISASQGIHLSVPTLWRILIATQFYSMLLPGPLVGGGATWLKYLQHGADRTAAAAAILLNRGIGFLVMIAAGTLAWLVDAPRVPLWSAAAVLAAGAALVALLSGSSTPGLPAQSGGSWIARGAGRVRRPLLLFGRIRPRDKALVLVSSLALELVAAAVLWCFARAAGLTLPLVTVLWMRAALQVVLLAPITLAGLGVREASLVGLCALVGVAAAPAVTWSLTIFLGTLVVAASGGILEAGGASRLLLRRAAAEPPPPRPGSTPAGQ